MLRYYCRNFYTTPEEGSQLSADFVWRVVPPWMKFTVIDWNKEETWTLSNTRWNAQSRESLESLQPSERWRMRVGLNGHGIFRAVVPALICEGMTITLDLNVEVSWGSSFINITGKIDNDPEDFVLFSLFDHRKATKISIGFDHVNSLLL